MWNTSKITIISLLIVVSFLLFFIIRLEKKYDSINEFASFAAVSIYQINKDLEENKFEYAKKSMSETYQIIKKTQETQKFQGRYWQDFDYYAFGVTW